MLLLESYRYRLSVRRFIIDLFDKTVIENLVKEGAAELGVEGEPQSPEEVVRSP
jgi:rapamycin-insensitive companion of mTOR